MTHFIGAVLVPKYVPVNVRTVHHEQFGGYDSQEPNKELEGYLDHALRKFDENRDVPVYVKYTREGLIEHGRKEIEDYKNGRYAEYLADPEKYVQAHGSQNPRHIDYITREFPKRLDWTDEQVYAEQIQFYEDSEIGENGEVYSTYNPHSKWDWYQVGGRWHEEFEDRQGETVATVQAKLAEVDPDDTEWWFPRGFVVPNGHEDFEWIARGTEGWWGYTHDEFDKEAWYKLIDQELSELDPDDKIVYVDFHI